MNLQQGAVLGAHRTLSCGFGGGASRLPGRPSEALGFSWAFCPSGILLCREGPRGQGNRNSQGRQTQGDREAWQDTGGEGRKR